VRRATKPAATSRKEQLTEERTETLVLSDENQPPLMPKTTTSGSGAREGAGPPYRLPYIDLCPQWRSPIDYNCHRSAGRPVVATVVPLSETSERLQIAMADPTTLRSRRTGRALHCRLIPFVATAEQ